MTRASKKKQRSFTAVNDVNAGCRYVKLIFANFSLHLYSANVKYLYDNIINFSLFDFGLRKKNKLFIELIFKSFT